MGAFSILISDMYAYLDGMGKTIWIQQVEMLYHGLSYLGNHFEFQKHFI